MKVGSDTLLTLLVSLSMATVSGAGTLIWWVAGLQGRVKNNEKDIANMQDIQKEENKKVTEMDKSMAVMQNNIQTILKVVNEIKNSINERNIKK